MPFLQTVQEQRSVPVQPLPPPSSIRDTAFRGGLLFLIALAAIAVDGYHPYSEDAAIYVAGIKQLANPSIYGSSGVFIAPYLRLSGFFTLNSWLLRLLHLPLPWLLFTLQIATTWLLLYACLGLAQRCFDSPAIPGGRPSLPAWCAVLLVAFCLAIPVAGTSLFMMDPYLTSRSFSTPLTLLAISACLDRNLLRTIVLLALIAILHPLMVLYAAFFVITIWTVERQAWFSVATLSTVAIAAAAGIQYSQRLVVETVAHQNAVGSRYYFFLANWHWYEQLGVVAPLLILAGCALWQRRRNHKNAASLAISAVILGLTSIVIALCFARDRSHSHLVATLQPLRFFILIYIFMFLVIGEFVGRQILKRSVWRWVFFFGGVAIGLAVVQHQAFPASAQVEFPWIASSNGWNRAFVWIRDHTPTNAIVAIDADYIHAHGEDGQGFRAIAERNTLADRSKDGGAATLFPQLAERWMQEQTATTNLNRIDDAERLRRLSPYKATWVVLQAGAATSLICPFEDDLAKVCRLP